MESGLHPSRPILNGKLRLLNKNDDDDDDDDDEEEEELELKLCYFSKQGKTLPLTDGLVFQDAFDDP